MTERTIGEVARELGVTVDTLRLYERRELLLSPVDRDAGQRRRYRDDDVEWLQTCLYLRGTGMSLADIAHYAKLVRAGDGNERERLELLHRHLDEVNRRLAEVQGWAQAVEQKVRYYEEAVAGTPSVCAAG